jgi:chromosome partitioning protein
MRITTIINGKGGVAKTTTTQALGTGLDKAEYNPLVIDYDAQGNLSASYGLKEKECPTFYHILNGDILLEEAIQKTEQGDIIAGNASLSKIEALFNDPFTGMYALKEQLKEVGGYTHIFIDNQPLIAGFLTRQTLVATHDIVIPVTADSFTLQGLNALYEAFTIVKKHANPEIKIDGLLLTRHNPRLTLKRDIQTNLEEWATVLKTKVYKTHIREGVAVQEAQATKQSLFKYDGKSNPAKDYKAFILEYLEG